MTVWAYSESYVRFAAVDYDASTTNKYAHLTNNCVVKKFMKQEYGDEENSDDEEELDLDNIWSSDDFADHLNSNYSSRFPDKQDLYEEVIWP